MKRFLFQITNFFLTKFSLESPLLLFISSTIFKLIVHFLYPSIYIHFYNFAFCCLQTYVFIFLRILAFWKANHTHPLHKTCQTVLKLNLKWIHDFWFLKYCISLYVKLSSSILLYFICLHFYLSRLFEWFPVGFLGFRQHLVSFLLSTPASYLLIGTEKFYPTYWVSRNKPDSINILHFWSLFFFFFSLWSDLSPGWYCWLLDLRLCKTSFRSCITFTRLFLSWSTETVVL